MDVVVAATLGGATLIDNAAHPWHAGETVSGPAILVAVAAAYGAVPFRRRWPVPTSAATLTAAAFYMTLSSLY